MSQLVAEAAIREIADRVRHCGADAYPFTVSHGTVQASAAAVDSSYVFLLLLTLFGHNRGPRGLHGEKLFEDMCSHAARAYFGGLNAHSHVFGFPRRLLPKDFCSALDKLCTELGDGHSSNRKLPKSKEQKDAKLDIVVWRDFADARNGKAVGFGQCATARRDWAVKAREMSPEDFSKIWMTRAMINDPLRLFFVPWRVEADDWDLACTRGGILMERCRISHLEHAMTAAADQSPRDRAHALSLRKSCQQWNSFILNKLSKSKRERVNAT